MDTPHPTCVRVIYIYFLFCSRENSSFMAVPLVSEGATVVAVGYELCPDG